MTRLEKAIKTYECMEQLPFTDLVVSALRLKRDVERYSSSSNVIKILEENEDLREKLRSIGIEV